jgi:hypothetical protein
MVRFLKGRDLESPASHDSDGLTESKKKTLKAVLCAE